MQKHHCSKIRRPTAILPKDIQTFKRTKPLGLGTFTKTSSVAREPHVASDGTRHVFLVPTQRYSTNTGYRPRQGYGGRAPRCSLLEAIMRTPAVDSRSGQAKTTEDCEESVLKEIGPAPRHCCDPISSKNSPVMASQTRQYAGYAATLGGILVARRRMRLECPPYDAPTVPHYAPTPTTRALHPGFLVHMHANVDIMASLERRFHYQTLEEE